MQISSITQATSKPVAARLPASPKPDTGATLPLDEVSLTSTSEPTTAGATSEEATSADATSAEATPADSTSEDATPAEATPAAGGSASPAETPSDLKAFGYGALGIDLQPEQASPQAQSYSAGQWTGAALKVGGIIALLA
jgi:hypothetical protein